MALSKRAKEILVVAMADKKAAEEIIEALDAATDKIADLEAEVAALEARVDALENP